MANAKMANAKMATIEELERAWSARGEQPRDRGTVVAIGLRKGDGVHEAPKAVQVSIEDGVVGDRWTADKDPTGNSQITLMNALVAGLVAGEQRRHETGDNFFVDLDLGEANLPEGARMRIGTALFEVTPEPHTGCSKFSARFGAEALRWTAQKERRSQRLRGIHCRVVESGEVRVGDPVEVLRRGD